MAHISKEKKYYEISQMPQWGLLRDIMKEELGIVCNLDEIESLGEMEGAKFCKKWVDSLTRRIDGAKDMLQNG